MSDPLTGDELREAIAREVYGWRPCWVPPDANGENAGNILTPTGEFPEGWTPPPVGRLYPAHLVPDFRHIENSLALAREVGLPLLVSQIPDCSESLAWLCLEYHRRQQAMLGS